jgi:hypothetical protein
MTEFVLLYRNTAEATQAAMGSPEGARLSLAKWYAWMDEMRRNGQLKDAGIALQPGGATVRKGHRMTDGPFAEAKELVAGFSVIEARDLDHAGEIAAACPILEGGGSVEVRPVRVLPPKS